VTDWGRVVLTNAPAAEIASLSPENNSFVREGETLTVKVGVKGDVDGLKLSLKVIDANDRVIGEKKLPAAAQVEEKFSLENALRSFSTRVIAELLQGDHVVARRLTFLLTRPDPDKCRWDDYMICTGGNSETRYWLFPHIAKMYRDACITKVSGQWPFRDYMCPRYNFFTSESALAGITMQSEPPEYAKTGDKTKLVRRACVIGQCGVEYLAIPVRLDDGPRLLRLRSGDTGIVAGQDHADGGTGIGLISVAGIGSTGVGRAGVIVGLVAAAGHQRQDHQQAQSQSENSFHHVSSFKNYTGFFG
jgi:hypothetical protein